MGSVSIGLVGLPAGPAVAILSFRLRASSPARTGHPSGRIGCHLACGLCDRWRPCSRRRCCPRGPRLVLANVTAASVFVLLVLVVLVRVEASFGGAVVLVLGGVVDLLATPQNSLGSVLSDRHCVSANSSFSIALVATLLSRVPIGCLRAPALRHARSGGSGVPSVLDRHSPGPELPVVDQPLQFCHPPAAQFGVPDTRPASPRGWSDSS